MSNETNTPDSTPAFDLFGLPDEDNLKEQLAKGSFQWTNKYTRILAIVLVLMGCLSAGAVYGHYSATKATSAGGLTAGNLSSLRAAFGGGGGGGGGSGAAGAGAAGGFGGGGFSRGTAGTVTKVSGTTVTITLTATPTTPIKAGDNVTVRGATAAGAAGGFGGAAASGSAPGSSAGSSAGTSAGAPGGAGTASGATSGTPRAGGAGGAGGGRFSNPAFTACLAKAGVTFTAGTRPDFTDPKVAAAIQSCATSLGLSAPGAGGFGGGAGRSAAPAPVTSGSPTP
jgi:hypothetical protein